MSTNRSQTPLDPPNILSIDNGNSEQLILKVKPIANAKCYEVQDSTDNGATWTSGGLFTNSRAMPVNGLTPGKSYTFRVRAVGGSSGASDWSDPMSHMSL